jgi:LPS O-antigen subunit length determinant protein (WzzB/FepE family)
LELLIDGIKSNGFDKMKSEVERKAKIKQELEKNIERLKNSLKISNGNHVDCETKTTKMQLENNFMFTSGGVKFFFNFS